MMVFCIILIIYVLVLSIISVITKYQKKMISSINHHNPCKDKVHNPILKSSMTSSLNNSEFGYQMGKQTGQRGLMMSVKNNKQPIEIAISSIKNECPQILKIRNCRSYANILPVENVGSQNVGAFKPLTELSKKKKIKKQWDQDENTENILINKFVHKRSVQTILGGNQNISKKSENLDINVHQICNKEEQQQNVEKLLQQNNELNAILTKKQMEAASLEKTVKKIEEEYIRMLEVSNQCNQSQIKILLHEDEANKEVTKNISNRSLRNSSISEKAQKLKLKLEKLDISSIKNSHLCINNNHSKENSFKLSEMVPV